LACYVLFKEVFKYLDDRIQFKFSDIKKQEIVCGFSDRNKYLFVE